MKPKLHPSFRYRVDYVGKEREPVLVIENFLENADTLVNFAVQSSRFNMADAYYPGVRSPAPDLYIETMNYYLQDLVKDVFGLSDTNIAGVKADFSMVTTLQKQLKPMQCIPHFDSTKRSELAVVHYLCQSDKGGTSLYRHRATGFEFVDSTRADEFAKVVALESTHRTSIPSYINGSNEYYEQIASYEATFNSLIMYRCTSLHSGNIAPDFNFDSNPRNGRLTLNTFIYCRE